MFIHDVLVEHLMGGQTQLSDNSLVTQVPALVSSSNGLSLNTSQTLGLRNTLEAQYKVKRTPSHGMFLVFSAVRQLSVCLLLCSVFYHRHIPCLYTIVYLMDIFAELVG